MEKNILDSLEGISDSLRHFASNVDNTQQYHKLAWLTLNDKGEPTKIYLDFALIPENVDNYINIQLPISKVEYNMMTLTDSTWVH